MDKVFNTAGACHPDIHYMLPPLERLPGIERLINTRSYFVLHAPRQTGKTTSFGALAKKLTAEGRYAAALVTMQHGAARVAGEADALRGILDSWRKDAELQLPSELRPPPWPDTAVSSAINAALTAWAEACPRPLVLFLDEIDALQGPRLISVLHQLRVGHGRRPGAFPASLALIGLRDVADYKYSAGGTDPPSPEATSPFNILVKSLTMANFTFREVERLYHLHTEATGQVFQEEAIARAFELTKGQPWLVNALGYTILDELTPTYARDITVEDVDQARRRLVARQDTHLRSLASRLRDPRVSSVIRAVFSDGDLSQTLADDIRFSMDLGLVQKSQTGGLALSNPIYQEVLLEELTFRPSSMIPTLQDPSWMTGGKLDPAKLLQAFMDFWAQHGSLLMSAAEIPELAPHIVTLAFLQRVVNGGGWVNREHPSGPDRMDVFVEHRDLRLAVELKVWRDRRANPVKKGLGQLEGYMRHLRTDQGWLIIFDKRSTRTSGEEASSALRDVSQRMTLERKTTPGGLEVAVLVG